jgi:hypothetical protein
MKFQVVFVLIESHLGKHHLLGDIIDHEYPKFQFQEPQKTF